MRSVCSIIFFLLFISSIAFGKNGVREVSSTSCNVIRVNVALDMTTQILFDQEPKVTLYADKKHFKISTNSVSPRSVGIIPFVESSELNVFGGSRGKLPPPSVLVQDLDNSFKTNLFVFFENNNQLMFELRFVDKKKADYVLNVKQIFTKDCTL